MMTPYTRAEISNMSWDDLTSVVALVQNRRNVLDSLAAMRLSLGQKVRFTGKRGRTVTGQVKEIKRNGKIIVNNCSDGMSWRLPAGMVTVVPTTPA